MTYSIAQVAHSAKVSRALVNKLVKAGKLQGAQAKPRGKWVITDTLGHAKEVIREVAPSAGYRKPTAKSNQKTASVTLQGLLDYAKLSEEKRTLLLSLGDRYSESELQILLDL